MAIPVYERQLGMNGIPGVRVPEVQTSEGTAEQAFGRDVKNLADAALAKYQEFEDANTLETLNQFQREVSDYHNNPEKGIYSTRTGKDAGGASGDSDAWITELAGKYAGGLSGRAGTNFMKHAERIRNGYYEANQKWEAGQLRVYRDSEADAAITLGIDAIGRDYAGEEAVAEQRALIYQALELKMRGAGPDAWKAAVLEMEERIALTRLSRIAGEDPGNALEWLEEHKDSLSGASYLKAKDYLDGEMAKGISAAAADSFWREFGTDERAAKTAIFAGESLSIEQKDSVWARYEAMASDEKRFRAEAENAMYSDIWEKIQAAPDYRTITAEIEASDMTPEQKVKARNMAKRFWTPGEKQDDLGTYLYVYGAVKRGDITDPNQLARYADLLTPSTIKSFGKDILDGVLKFESVKISGDLDSMVDDAFRNQEGRKKGGVDYYEKTQFLTVLRETLRARQEEKGAALTDMEKLLTEKSLLADVYMTETPKKWSKYKRYEVLAAEAEGYVWNSRYQDFVKTKEDPGTGNGYTADTWKDREKRLSTGADENLPAPGTSGSRAGSEKTLTGLFLPGGGTVTSVFGAGESFRKSPHRGVDIGGRLGDPVTAPPGVWKVA
ncbi:MAG: hypothetical protein LBR87_03080, partial [Synergistaceae bacterium]|nr:hypothetical protein [Synergistaceae bacterium]